MATAKVTDGSLVQIDPKKVLVEANAVRYGVLKADVDAMKQSILDLGGVQTPVEIEPTDVKGFDYKLTVGFKRHQAVTELNADGAGLTLPAIVRTLGDPLMRLRHQLSENLDRKSLSPMDMAVAIKALVNAKVERAQIREMFKRPGGKKGLEVKPASNAWVNMTLSFLELPKEIREKIHDGRVGVAAAYELTKVPAEKRATVLARAEQDREDALDREEKDEAKFIAAEEKVQSVAKKEEEAVAALDVAQAEVELAEKAHNEELEKAQALYKKARMADKDGKKAADEAFKAAEADSKGSEKKLTEARKALTKLAESRDRLQKQAAEHREKLEAARAGTKAKVGKPKGKAVGPGDVKKAASKEGGKVVALTAAEMKKTIADLALPGTYPKVSEIGAAVKRCFDGESSPGQMLKELAGITGELKSKK